MNWKRYSKSLKTIEEQRRFRGFAKVHLRFLLLVTVLLLFAGFTLTLPGALADEGPEPQLGPTGSYDTTDYARDVTVVGNYAYVADSNSGLVVVDVSDPLNPTRVGSYDTLDYARAVAVAGDYAYVADSNSGLVVIDVSDPANPTRVGRYDISGYTRGVALSGSYAYVADEVNGLLVVDVSNPANLTLVSRYDTLDYARAVTVAGDYAYVADGNNGLLVVDVSDPANPIYGKRYDISGYVEGVTIAGGYAYVATGLGLVVVDVSDPANPYVGQYDTSGYAWSVTVSGSYVWVADGVNGLLVVDVSNPANLTLVENYNTPGYVRNVAVASDYAYVADGVNGLLVLGPDSDGDGAADMRDVFPSDPDEWADTDSDGVGDNGDAFPETDWLRAWWQLGLILAFFGIATYSTSFSFLTKRAFREAEQAMEEWEREDVNTAPVRKLLDEGHQKWQRFNYPAAMVLAGRAKEKGEEHAREHGNVKRIFNHVEETLQGHEAKGVQVGPALDLLEQARSAWDEMDFQKADELAREAEAEGTVLESQYQEAAERVTELKAKIAEFEEKGVNTDELEKVLEKVEAEMGTE